VHLSEAFGWKLTLAKMSALSVIAANLMNPSMIPLSLRTGATSQSDPTAGGDTGGQLPTEYSRHVTTTDKAGAGILTVLISSLFIGGAWWLIS
jgi:mannan endo-1,6-alpha-mannosidase